MDRWMQRNTERGKGGVLKGYQHANGESVVAYDNPMAAEEKDRCGMFPERSLNVP
jgi:hypothetical protein